MDILQPRIAEEMGVAQIVERDVEIKILFAEIGQRIAQRPGEMVGVGEERDLGAVERGEIDRLIMRRGVDGNEDHVRRVCLAVILEQRRQIVAPLRRCDGERAVALRPVHHERADGDHMLREARRRNIGGLGVVTIEDMRVAFGHGRYALPCALCLTGALPAHQARHMSL